MATPLASLAGLRTLLLCTPIRLLVGPPSMAPPPGHPQRCAMSRACLPFSRELGLVPRRLGLTEARRGRDRERIPVCHWSVEWRRMGEAVPSSRAAQLPGLPEDERGGRGREVCSRSLRRATSFFLC